MTTDSRRAAAFAFALAGLVSLAAAMPAQAQEQGRLTGLALDNDQPIEIESDQLEVFEEEGLAIFTGNVEVVQGATLLKGGKMTVYYDNEGGGEGSTDGGSAATGSADIERIEIEGKVYVRSEEQVATGDRGTFDMASEVLTLSGREVVLSEGENVIVGCLLTVQMATGQAKLDGCGNDSAQPGRVKMLLQPGSQDR